MTSNDYRTSDFWIAATLMTLGEQVSDVDRSQGRRAFFVFEHSPSLEQNIESYKAGKVLVEPQNLFVQTRLLKNRLYDDR